MKLLVLSTLLALSQALCVEYSGYIQRGVTQVNKMQRVIWFDGQQVKCNGDFCSTPFVTFGPVFKMRVNKCTMSSFEVESCEGKTCWSKSYSANEPVECAFSGPQNQVYSCSSRVKHCNN